ncbi:MAG: hypothetical protein M3321_00180 [Actinomycetota bacterium]|nr:hypothetical protein [Actinomycetota bacterium]
MPESTVYFGLHGTASKATRSLDEPLCAAGQGSFEPTARPAPASSGPIGAAAQEVKHLHQLERAGESEWTPWIAVTGLILFFVAIGLLMFGIVETASHLLASASSEG